MSRTKIVATIGPVTCNPESLRALAAEGMSVARLNGSHATLDWHRSAIELIRSTLPHVPILLDIPGRKIRTVSLAHEPEFAVGENIVLTTDTSSSDREKVPVTYPNLHADLKPGDIVFADDGTLRFVVDAIEGKDIVCRAQVPGRLKSRKGINVPLVRLNMPLVTDRDREMIAFARETGVDYIGISFVESGEHLEAIRTVVGGPSPQLLAKVENRGGLENLGAIVAAADAIMIDRGDLCVETTMETLALEQKRIIDSARGAGKPVVVATEMLHSMIENDFPTKAEVSDIANAVLDGCSATMLSGETAVGRFPQEAVATMRRVADATARYLQDPLQAGGPGDVSAPQAMGDAIASILRALPITKVVAITRSGYAARVLSSRLVSQPILAISDDETMARAFNIYRGVEGVFFDAPFPRGSADHVKSCLKRLYDLGRIDQGDLILVTGVIYPRSGTRMNLIQVHRVADLVDVFKWTSATTAQRQPDLVPEKPLR